MTPAKIAVICLLVLATILVAVPIVQSLPSLAVPADEAPAPGPLSAWQQTIAEAAPADQGDRQALAAQFDELGDVIIEDAELKPAKLYFAGDILEKFDAYTQSRPAPGVDPAWGETANGVLRIVREKLSAIAPDADEKISIDQRKAARGALHLAAEAIR